MALLGLAYALVALSGVDGDVRPAPDEPGLGGLSNFAKALQGMGYRVTVDPSTRPRLDSSDVVIAPVLSNQKIPETALQHVREGGRGFIIGVHPWLQPIKGVQSVKNSLGRRASVDATEAAPADPQEPKGSLATASNWSGISSLQQIGKGRLARLDAGALATNRFLSRRENARVVLASLGTVSQKGDRLVFIAEGYGEASAPGPIEAIGPWAVGALWQSLVLLAAFGLSRGIRFGLPAPDRTQRRGSRELLEAVATFYRRGRYTNAAVASAAKEHPQDKGGQAVAARPNLSEEDARLALIELDSRSRKGR